MQFRLVVTEGQRQGQEFVVKDTITIGRKEGDLQLLDSKASQKHARILNENGQIQIEDLGSSNGTYVNNVKITKQTLKEGDLIRIGKTVMRFETVAVKQAPNEPETGTWQNEVARAIDQSIEGIEKISRLRSVTEPFDAPVELEFIRGIQTGTKVVFGFGPRQLGALCNDCLLYEPNVPDVAFELRPVKGGLCELRTQAELVLVNGAHSKNCKLENGDRISIGHTVILIKALET